MMRRLLLLLAFVPFSSPAFAQSAGNVGPCDGQIEAAELQYSLPKGVLHAIATVESSYRDPETGVRAPWPWTVNVAGAGRYFASLEEAKKAVVAALAGNVDSVDVGCMQVNLRAHPQAFSSLDQAFEPATNVNYGAQLLQKNYFETKSWSEAIRRYHAPPGSPNGILYLSKVMAYWRASLGWLASPLREAVDRTPKPLDLAAQAFDKGDYGTARNRYLGILKAKPDDRIAHLGLAMSAEKLADTGTAQEHYERVLVYDPYNRAAIDGLVRLAEPQPPAMRLERLGNIRRLAPEESSLPAMISDIHVQLGNLNLAAKALAEALEIEPEHVAWRLNLASLYDRLGDRKAAIAQYSRFLKDYRPAAAPVPVAIEDIKRRLAWLSSN